MTPLRVLAELVGSLLIVLGIVGIHLIEFAEQPKQRLEVAR